jgi:hypothetical protein
MDETLPARLTCRPFIPVYTLRKKNRQRGRKLRYFRSVGAKGDEDNPMDKEAYGL